MLSTAILMHRTKHCSESLHLPVQRVVTCKEWHYLLPLCPSAETPVHHRPLFFPELRVCTAAWLWREETRSSRASQIDWTENSPRKLPQWVPPSAPSSDSPIRILKKKPCCFHQNHYLTGSSSSPMCLCVIDRVWGWSWLPTTPQLSVASVPG